MQTGNDIKKVSIGIQDFEKIRERDVFYIDKSGFIRDWWNSKDDVTLIARPRRFGKTLNMSMMECFFSVKYEARSDLFEGLEIWQDEAMRKEQGTWPVIFLSFADVKQEDWEQTRLTMNAIISAVYRSYDWLIQDSIFTDADRAAFYEVYKKMDNNTAAQSLKNLSSWLERYYKKKVLIFLDEYDTPMQEAWIQGYWNKMVNYIRNLFNSTFKTNPSLGRAILTGITRVSKESIFSDMNNLEVVTTTSFKYATAFGFTEAEVFQAMEDQGCPEADKAKIKEWYDGFNFGGVKDIYNPWSVTNYLDKRIFKAWWANTSSNGLIGQQLRKGIPAVKRQFETLLQGGELTLPISEEITFNQLESEPMAIWSLMLASGYLKVVPPEGGTMRESSMLLTLTITNKETKDTLEAMVRNWFGGTGEMPPFMRAMMKGDAKTMGRYLNDILRDTISYFDTGKGPSEKEPENFYHGLVLGLIAEKAGEYKVLSNRESGYGRYDVVMEPKDRTQPAVILEFKVFDVEDDEEGLEDTAANALKQIEEMQYDRDLIASGIPVENIHKYGVAFQGKKCIVRKASGEGNIR